MARTKKTVRAKEPVRIRFKKLANGNQSIYLDIYSDGCRSYEFLNLYLVPGADSTSKEQNKHTLKVANAIKSERIIDLANGKAGIKKANDKSKMLLSDWMDVYIQKKREQGRSDKNARNLVSLKNHLIAYKGNKVRMCDVSKSWCVGFISYLSKAKAMNSDKKSLSKNTADMYFTKLSCVLEDATKDGIIASNPVKMIATEEKKPISPEENQRCYLTIDEVRAMIKADCSSAVIKQAFLFACFCGLRISDIRNLEWGDIHTDSNGQSVIEKTMQKTGKNLYLPLSDEAVKWMPERENSADDEAIFASIPTYNTVAYTVKAWAKNAGIDKDICFHVSRHTFATMALTLGADLYTTSKLLGHTKIATTQIYAEIVNQKKNEAVNLMNGIFD